MYLCCDASASAGRRALIFAIVRNGTLIAQSAIMMAQLQADRLGFDREAFNEFNAAVTEFFREHLGNAR
ncbi:MAG: hypothetical protein V7608_3480 [Hyphomicrobiales bacterium]|jgi:hypothetical protein